MGKYRNCCCPANEAGIVSAYSNPMRLSKLFIIQQFHCGTINFTVPMVYRTTLNFDANSAENSAIENKLERSAFNMKVVDNHQYSAIFSLECFYPINENLEVYAL
jgi:hypothetical protein